MAVVIRPYTVGAVGVTEYSGIIQIPAGTHTLQVGFVVLPGMFSSPDLCLRLSSAYKLTENGSIIGGGTGIGSTGSAELVSGGIAGGDPGIIPGTVMTNFTMDWRDSAYLNINAVNEAVGSGTLPVGSVLPVVATTVCGGNPSGTAYALVAEAYDINNNILTW